MTKILENKNCRNCKKEFIISDDDQVFYDKLQVPRPSFCPDCRQQRRLAFRNERFMYRRKCDFSGKEIVSMYPPDSPFKVYEQEIWWSDQLDPLKYGQSFDFNRSFLEQFRELQLKVPRVALVNKQSENSDYTNHSGKNRNCYMSAVTFGCEDIYYSDFIMDHSIECVDCSYLFEGCQLCYETYYAWSSYKAFFCDFIRNCSEIWFSYDCFNTKNSFMCWNLRNKEYCIRNKQFSKENYEMEMKKIFSNGGSGYCVSSDKLQELRKEYINIKERIAIKPATYKVQTENSSGDLLFETKDTFHAFDSIKVENCRYVYDTSVMKDSMDAYHAGIPGELLYECHAISNGYNLKFCHFCYDNSNLSYCDCCHNSKNLFGCVGLKHNEYCILNKQYTKEEYEALVPRIIEHMKKNTKGEQDKEGCEYGEFFPIQFSPFAYNQSRAQEYYPLNKEEAKKESIRWSDYDPPIPNVTKHIESSAVQQSIQDVTDDILNVAIICEKSKRPFKIIKQELNFYRKTGLPIPRHHPDQRYLDRLSQRPSRKLWQKNCKKCQTSTETAFSPNKSENVYCQKCYLEEIY